jgi:hypothetical protein
MESALPKNIKLGEDKTKKLPDFSHDRSKSSSFGQHSVSTSAKGVTACEQQKSESPSSGRPRRSRWDLESSDSVSASPSIDEITPEAKTSTPPTTTKSQKFVEIEEGELSDRLNAKKELNKKKLDEKDSKPLESGFAKSGPRFSLKPTTLGFSKQSTLKPKDARDRFSFNETNDESETGSKKRSRLFPLQYAQVPETVQDVLAYPVNWSGLTDDASHQIQGAVLKIVTDYLGNADDDLSEYLVQTIHEKLPCEDIITEMKFIFDEDASKFVASLWREVIRFTN